MRHFLGSEGKEARKGDVYAGIKGLVADSDSPSVRLVMTRMEQLSVLYSRIATVGVEPIQELERFFVRFRRLDFGTVYPLLLSLYEDYEDAQFGVDEFIASLRVLDSYIIRRMVVGVPSNSLSGTFISFCKSKPVTENPSAWLSGALANESKNRRWPTDSEFFERWVRVPIYGSRSLCQVVLEGMEEQFGHHEAVQPADATIEHVLPQTLTPEWEAALGDDPGRIHSDWLHTIGNLTLTGYNPELSNKAYPDKRIIYALSHFELNRYFCGCESWSSKEIQQRAESLFASALKLWPRPSMAVEEEPAVHRPGPAAFHSDCIRVAQRHLGVTFSKLSQTRYEAGDRGTRLVCAVSAERNNTAGIPQFWFGVNPIHVKFLEAAPAGWLCLGCGSAAQTLLIPVSVFKPLLEQMSVSAVAGHWHVVVQRKNTKLILRLLGAVDGPELNGFLVPVEGV
jgi:hypothetical protein